MVSTLKAPKMPPITFISIDFKAIDPVQDDSVIISVEITNCMVQKTLIDQWSSIDILFWDTFKQLNIPETKHLSHDETLFDFIGEIIGTRGSIWLFY